MNSIQGKNLPVNPKNDYMSFQFLFSKKRLYFFIFYKMSRIGDGICDKEDCIQCLHFYEHYLLNDGIFDGDDCISSDHINMRHPLALYSIFVNFSSLEFKPSCSRKNNFF